MSARPVPFPGGEVLSAAERAFYEAERRRYRGFFRRPRGLIGVLVLASGSMVAVSLLDRGDVWPALAVFAAVAAIEGGLVAIHLRKPDRAPLIEVTQGEVAIEDEPEQPHARWWIGEQQLHLPPHWAAALSDGQHARVRLAKAPGEALGFALAIDGKRSAVFEAAAGLPPSAQGQPGTMLVLVAATLGVLLSTIVVLSMFVIGDTSFRTAALTLEAVAAGTQDLGAPTDIHSAGLPERGVFHARAVTMLPRSAVTSGPAGAAWVGLSPEATAHWISVREAKNARAAGAIPKPDETSEPITLRPGDALFWRSAELFENLGPTGRPGDQVLLWLTRTRDVTLVRTRDDDGDEPLLRAPEDAEQLTFAAACLGIGVLCLPTLLLALARIRRSRSVQSRFESAVTQAYRPH